MGKSRIISNKKERVLLSDVLPYEVPVTFTNRGFCDFLTKNKITYDIHEERLSWRYQHGVLDRVISLIFDLNFSKIETSNGFSCCDFKKGNSSNNKKNKSDTTIPFTYKINHKINQYRDLSVPHPLSQLKIVNFYNTYKELMIYYCNRSHYSIRHPKKVANYKYYKDVVHYTHREEDDTVIEVSNKEYENLRSYFVYEKYSNIYQFYESYHYHRAEKKFRHMAKLDISKCFDSIYTHSISWALLDKNLVKDDLQVARNTYPGRFDKLMQDIKYKETNGIIIGPEFSRIFAEHILQAIDISLLRELSKLNVKFEEDYSIFRYVDDYFVFYNTTECKENIVGTLQHELKQYNFYLNTEKELVYENPIVTEISMGKSKIRHLLDDVLKYKEEEIIHPDTKDIVIKYKLNAWNIKQLVLEYKIVLKSCQVQYRDVLNYTLALVERKIKKIFKKHCEIEQENRSEKQLANALNEIINFIYFIYSVNPKVNSTIRLCRILILIIKYYKKGFKGTRQFKCEVQFQLFDRLC